MKGRFFVFILVLISLFIFLPRIAFAKEETKNIEVKKGELINHDFFAAGESVTISGVVNGDVFAAGGSVTVDGIINGDLLAGAGIITILGEVSDDVRVGGGNIFINGIIGKNLTFGGGSVIISSEARIGGSLLAFTGTLDVKGPIGRDANVFAGKALFSNQVGGDLKGSIEELALTSEARILGDLEYESPEEADVAKGAIVYGETTHKLPKKPEKKVSELGKFVPVKEIVPVVFGIKLYFKFFSFVISLVLGLLFLYLFPKRAKGIVKVLESRPWASLGVGILTPILFVLVIVFLAISLIGIPLILIIVPLFVFLVYFSKIFTALFLGRKVLLRFNLSKSEAWALFAGLLIYYLLRLIPVISPIATCVFISFGLGAFILDQKSLRAPKKR